MRRLRRILLQLLGALLRRSAPRPPAQPARVLVVKPDHLGDVLLLTAALRLLRRRLPEAEITLLIGPWSAVAAAHSPDVDRVLQWPFPGFTRAVKGGLLQPYVDLAKLALLLRRGRYDAALIARDDHWWGALLAALAGIPRRLGFAVPEVVPFLTDALPHSFSNHAAAQALQLVERLTGSPADESPPLRAPIGAADREWAIRWLQQQGIGEQPPLVAIHPGAGGAAKLWLPGRWSAVGDALAARGMAIVVTGGPAEAALVEAVASGMQQRPHTIVGAATLGQLAALYERCAAVLGVDSGPLHLAVSTGVPTLALFGPGDAGRFGPWGDPRRHMVVRSGLWCSPCGVMDACPRGTAPSECMALIGVEQVLAGVENLEPGT